MRQLQSQEVKAVSGAGLLTGAISTGAEAGVAAGTGLVKGGAIVGFPATGHAIAEHIRYGHQLVLLFLSGVMTCRSRLG